MFAQIKAPANAKFSERAADYLRGGRNFPCPGTRPMRPQSWPLTCKDVARVTISVDFTPWTGGIDAAGGHAARGYAHGGVEHSGRPSDQGGKARPG